VDESRIGRIGRAFRTYLDIVLFRKGPEDLPVSQTLLIITIAANVLLGLALGTVVPLPDHNRVGVAAVETVFLLAWYWALLRFAGKPERFLQTTSAVFGHQTVLLPVFMLVTWLYLDQPKGAPVQPLVLIALITMAVWTLAIGSRILRAATQWPMAICIAAMLLQAVSGQILVLTLFPEAAATAVGAAAAPP
jgi:hypothetical protein